MTDWLLKCHTQMCYYYYYCYLTFLSPSTEPGVVVEGIERKGLEVHRLRMEVLEDPQPSSLRTENTVGRLCALTLSCGHL